MELFIKTYVFLIGLVIGSFLNVLIYRMPQKLSVAKGNSFCPDCRHKLNWLDLIPVFSFLFLRGKCRYCKSKISFRYPLVELMNALCYFVVYLVYGMQYISFIYALCCSCLIVISFIDIDHLIILNRFPVMIGLCGVFLAVFSHDMPWVERVIGLFAISVPLLLLAIITGGVGEGDIKLFAALGLLLGWKLVLLTMLFASIFGAVYGIVLIRMKKAKGKTQIPFGPFISFAAILAILAGKGIIEAYLALLLK